MTYLDEICLASMQASATNPMGSVVFGFKGPFIKVTCVLVGTDLDESLMITATLVKAARCSGLVYVSHLDLGWEYPRQVLGHAFSLGEQVSWMMAYSILDDGSVRMVQPFRLSVVAPAVEIIEIALAGSVEPHHLETAQIWLRQRGHSVLVA